MNNYAIEVENLNVEYKKGVFALKNISFKIKEGEYLGIIGPNGGGKTTLLKAILNLVEYSNGSIKFFGKNLKQVRKLIGYVPQFSDIDKSFPIVAKEVVLMGTLKSGFHPFFSYSQEAKDKALEVMKEVDIEHLADRTLNTLSGGEFQRLLIARALAQDPKILLLDEPTASVDPSSRDNIYSLLGRLNKKGTTILLVSHDTMAISSQVKSLACISESLVFHGEPELNDAIVEKMYGCQVDLLAHGVPHRVLATHKGGKNHD